jgi:hypothetical protein
MGDVILPDPRPLLQKRLDIHDRKQFELKLEYQPSGRDPKSKYAVEMFMFVPASLNVDADTYPRQDFYADVHNYIRFKTPVMDLHDLLASDASPLIWMERASAAGPALSQAELVYDAKLLVCAFRGALRRFQQTVDQVSEELCVNSTDSARQASLQAGARQALADAPRVLVRFRALMDRLFEQPELEEKTRAAFRLVDEYLSLSVEQFFRKAVADMDALPRAAPYLDLRRDLMAPVIEEEGYRKSNQLRSVLNPTGENEEYMQRLGFLKKYCMNILFLSARREQRTAGFEEALLAVAAGLAMAFATAVALWAQNRYSQVSLNFFLIIVVGYMMKDRIKEGLRRILTRYAARRLFDRSTTISDPVTRHTIGLCREKVDFDPAASAPEEIRKLRRTDDVATVSQGELSEIVIRYQKQITLNSEMLPRLANAPSGVTDIVRINVDHLLRDMDDPDQALEYFDLEHLSMGRVRASKAYPIDLAFRFTVDDADQKRTTLQMVRLILDRNGIKRMERFGPSIA